MSLQEKYNNTVTVTEDKEPEPTKRFRWRVVDDHSPKEIYNFTLYFTVFVFGILGAARGYDEGCISGATNQKSFKKLFGLSDPKKDKHQIADLKSNITSMVQLGSVGGALLAMWSVDYLGRVRALQEVCVIWIAGAIIQITARTVGQLYVGRLLEGFAIGQTTTIGPTFMSEVSPPAYRGLFGCLFSGAVYFGIFTSYAANYGSAKHISSDSHNQWIIPTSMKIALAGLVLIGSFFCVESPRWLVKVRKNDKALQNLCKLRRLPPDHPYIVGELSDINEAVLAEKIANEDYSLWQKMRDIFVVKSVRYRFFMIGAMSQVLGQWSGANAITIYANDLFSFIGVKGIETMKMTVILGVVKFVGAYFSAFFIIDFLGRRKALYIGISLQMLTILFFAIFLHIVPQATDPDSVLTKSQKAASKGAMAALYLSGVGWTMGFNSVQYLLGSEIFPLGLRSFGQSLIMVLHFANQFGNSKAVPKMLLAMDNFGAFYFFTTVCAMALFWSWFFIPEISGRSLESMEEVFNLPWYLIGRRGATLCPDTSEVNKINYNRRYSIEEVHNEGKDKPSHEFAENASIDSKENKV
ncbi:quinate permease [Suhomyces tanzawaensis NRRL Y-17324]|uniref:Quinate permease n=1 Tax=Suhomyces tanzawaensis NRRL Y-17324 TaxID=984487 RepID=A0A1E4SES1_9ASCO|nr:quinate permease [Suhomyces tanzawaensis NRRL Y-17324]ODV77988.1 quinate permease [Suhomyces tanzawaensis NRRL Y-17324]